MKEKSEIKTETVSAKIPLSVKKKLEEIAKKQDRKISYIISQMLAKNVNN